MKLLFKLLFLTILVSEAFGQDNEKLYPITQKNLWGYIDQTGRTMIKPKFLVAGPFSEGLAPVRMKGPYGYIDKTGVFVISPEFDLASPFNNGLAKVFIDGKPFFIDKKGNIIFQHSYKDILEFGSNSFATVITQTDKYGVINRSGDLLVDTVFAKISTFNNGVAVVTGFKHRMSYRDGVYERGVIDTLGNWIVRYGEYKDIGEFENGYAHVELITEKQKGYYDHKGVIDEAGNYRFTVPSKKWYFNKGNATFYQDIALASIYPVDPTTVKRRALRSPFDHKGAVNSNGEVILSNADWDELTPFALNRAFAKDKSGNWHLINTQGQILTSQPFRKILYDPHQGQAELLFQNGKAFVKTIEGWGAIDTTGEYVIEPNKLEDVEYDRLIRRGDIVFIEENSFERDGYPYRYGFWNATSNIIVAPRFHDIDMNGFGNGLIYVMEDGKMGYINAKGKKVWKQRNKRHGKQLNIDYMNSGYYYASSKYRKELAGFGGWAGSGNSSKRITSSAAFLPNTFQVKMDPKRKAKWAKKYKAIKLYVANTSKDTVYFEAQDSRLYLKIQAQDRNGNWRDIEYLPGSWCGNSYHTLFLAPNEFWEFATPVYQGWFKTKIRAELLYVKNREGVIYSNEIDGSINPGQFWNKRENHPRGLMDPY